MHNTLATRFARNTFVTRSETPLAEDQMRLAAPSIFAAGKHESRSDRYTYTPTIEVRIGSCVKPTSVAAAAQGSPRTSAARYTSSDSVSVR